MPPDGRNLISDLIKHADICGYEVGGCSYYCLLEFDAVKFGAELPDVLE